jgi:hypothetical protein
MITILLTYADQLLKTFIHLVLQFLSVLLSAILGNLFPLNDREPCKASEIKETGDKEGTINGLQLVFDNKKNSSLSNDTNNGNCIQEKVLTATTAQNILVEISHDSKVDILNEKLIFIRNEKLLVQSKITDITQKLSEIDDNLENDLLEDKMTDSGNTDDLTEMLVDLDTEFVIMKELEKAEKELLIEQLDLIPAVEFTETGRNSYLYEDDNADNGLTATFDRDTSNNNHKDISNSINHNTNKYDYNDNYANNYDMSLNTISICDKDNDDYNKSTDHNANKHNYNDNYVNNYDVNYNDNKKNQNRENLFATIKNENNGDIDELEQFVINKSNNHHINKFDDEINIGCGCRNIDNNNYNNGNNNRSSVDYNDNDNIHDNSKQLDDTKVYT